MKTYLLVLFGIGVVLALHWLGAIALWSTAVRWIIFGLGLVLTGVGGWMVGYWQGWRDRARCERPALDVRQRNPWLENL